MGNYTLLGEEHLEGHIMDVVNRTDEDPSKEKLFAIKRAYMLRLSLPNVIRELSPQVVYLEGRKEVYDAAIGMPPIVEKGKAKVVFLDENVIAYDIIKFILNVERPLQPIPTYYLSVPILQALQKPRERAWLEKMLKYGSGAVLLGKGHLKRFGDRLSDAGQYVVRRNLWKETKSLDSYTKRYVGTDHENITIMSL
jgi:hypothetical protein